ncbi:MAG: A24 family peptidase [archaeon]
MNFLLPVLAATIYLAYTSWLDIKTREVDDKVTDGFIIAAFVYQLAAGFYYGDMHIAVYAAVAGVALFIFGYIMFMMGQWGGADVKILAALGIMFGGLTWGGQYFLLDYFINVFIVAFFYSIAYSVGISLGNKDVKSRFRLSVSAGAKEIAGLLALVAGMLLAAGLYINYSLGVWGAAALMLMYPLLALAALVPMFWVLVKFVKVVEDVCFRLPARAKQLVEFDLLTVDILQEGKKLLKVPEKESTKARRKRAAKVVYDSSDPNGLTKDQVAEINKLVESGKLQDGFIVKWGLPFVPVFLIAIFATLIFGNMLYLFI